MIRRTTEILISLLFLIMTLPVSVIIAAVIKLEDGGSVFYQSHRIGFGGKKFIMYKFRTMKNENDLLSHDDFMEFQSNFKLSNDCRITRVGNFLRRYSLDEIPQFLNVLTGDMSIIGPRPKLPEEVDLYGENKSQLLSVLPGITGYWQVYRINANSDENMRRMDLYYIRNRSLTMDLKIFIKTFPALLIKKNY